MNIATLSNKWQTIINSFDIHYGNISHDEPLQY